ncbi:MAG: hypothetical protein GY854_06440 [Deltaproteobacteria bacterium]|nr:hypothetical protein [Deltaproteobacteria bacterium]
MRSPSFIRVAVVAMLVPAVSCSPATVSRIGPSVPPRTDDCDIEVLEPGETPSRPYRDVGMVTLENCQDYRSPPCREWLRRAACEIGGQVAYFTDEGRTNEQFGPVTFRVLVAAYVADLRYDPKTDPLYRSRLCDPPCKEDEKCEEGTCRPAAGADCTDKDTSENENQVERCLE